MKTLTDEFIGMNIKERIKIKIKETNKDIFLNQTLLDLTDCFSLSKLS